MDQATVANRQPNGDATRTGGLTPDEQLELLAGESGVTVRDFDPDDVDQAFVERVRQRLKTDAVPAPV